MRIHMHLFRTIAFLGRRPSLIGRNLLKTTEHLRDCRIKKKEIGEEGLNILLRIVSTTY